MLIVSYEIYQLYQPVKYNIQIPALLKKSFHSSFWVSLLWWVGWLPLIRCQCPWSGALMPLIRCPWSDPPLLSPAPLVVRSVCLVSCEPWWCTKKKKEKEMALWKPEFRFNTAGHIAERRLCQRVTVTSIEGQFFERTAVVQKGRMPEIGREILWVCRAHWSRAVNF